MTTLREPYRVEGKKTMGYEIAEQLEWTLPDVILYPTGAVRQHDSVILFNTGSGVKYAEAYG